MTTEDTLARLEALQPGMPLPISAHLMQGFWTLFYRADGREWALAELSGGSVEEKMQRAAYLVAAANAMPALCAEIRSLRATLVVYEDAALLADLTAPADPADEVPLRRP